MTSKVSVITRCALFAALTAVFAQFSFPLGPFPFSMGIFGAMLCGRMVSPWAAFLSQGVYVALGAVGLPVFAGLQGGFQCLLGPTGGFIIAYPFLALIVSLLCRKGGVRAFIGYGAGLCICYILGASVYAAVGGVDLISGFTVTVLPFVIPDVIKAVAVELLGRGITRRLGLSRR